MAVKLDEARIRLLKTNGTTTIAGGHVYLTGSSAGSSTGNTTQLVFGTSSANHVVLSANDNALVINPTTSSTTNQIVLYLNQASKFPSGIEGNASTASSFNSARTIALTGDVTGSASSNGASGWSIATTVGDNSHNHSYLSGWSDTRSATTVPNDYNGQLKVVGIKTATGSGTLDGSNYSTLVGIRGWSDSSGGNSHELAFTGNGALYRRHGSTTSWNAWVKVLDSSNYSSYALPLSGGTLSGALTVNSTITATGNIKGAYIQGTWLYTSAATAQTTATKIAVIHSDNYIYYITPANLTTLIKSNASGSWNITAATATKLGTATKGSATKPIYLSSGTPTECSTYAGGTAVTLNGSSKAATTASFYAPTSVGSANQFLMSNGSGAPTWTSANCKIDYTIDTTAYAKTNFYFIDFGSDDRELDCEIHSPNVGGNDAYNQNEIHFLLVHNGWSDTPKSLTILHQGNYAASELTIMSIVVGNEGGLRGVYVRGGLKYRIRSNAKPTLNTTTRTNGNESFASGTTSITTLTKATTLWTNDGSNRASFSVPLYGAVWNDYAEFRWVLNHPDTDEPIESGRCVAENGNDSMSLTHDRLQAGARIISDTYGMCMGETEKAKTPVAVCGRVLAYPFERKVAFNVGDPVCSGPNGTVSKMSREEAMMYPERIVGTVVSKPTYKEWGPNKIPVKGRIWIQVR